MANCEWRFANGNWRLAIGLCLLFRVLFTVEFLLYSSLVLDHEDYVDILVQVVIICIFRFESLHAAAVRHAHPSSDSNGRDQAKNIYIISMALDQGLSLIDSLVTDYSNDSYNYVDQRERLQSLDIVKEIVRMVELVLSGFRFMEPSHF